MKLLLSFSFDDCHLKDWKCMHSELYHKVNLKLKFFIGWPVWIVFIYFWAFSTSTNNRRKPILILKNIVGYDSHKKVKKWVKTELENVSGFGLSGLPLIFRMNYFLDFVSHQMVISIFRDLYNKLITNMQKKPIPHHESESTEKT